MLTKTNYVCGLLLLLTGFFTTVINDALADEQLAQQAAALGLPSPVIKLVNNQQPRYLPVQAMVKGSASITWFAGHQNTRWLTHLNAKSSVQTVAKIADCVFFLDQERNSCATADALVSTHESDGVWEWVEADNVWQCDDAQSCTVSEYSSGYEEWQSNPKFSLLSMMQGRGEAHFVWLGQMDLSQLYQQALALGRQPGNHLQEHGQWLQHAMSVNFQRGNWLHQLQASTHKDKNVHLFWIVQTVTP